MNDSGAQDGGTIAEGRSATKETVVLALTAASLGYATRAVLNDVNLQIHAGDFVGLAGANGAGKTTLLRSMLGLLPLRSGVIERNLPLANVGYVPQTSALDSYFPLSVTEVIAMGVYGRVKALTRLPRAERVRVATVLDQVGLAHLARMAFFNLSGGQQQRVLIARALAMDPGLLLLDEPLSGVDQDSKEGIINLLMRINQQRGLAVVISSHEQEVLEKACRGMVLVSGGHARIKHDWRRTESGAAER